MLRLLVAVLAAVLSSRAAAATTVAVGDELAAAKGASAAAGLADELAAFKSWTAGLLRGSGSAEPLAIPSLDDERKVPPQWDEVDADIQPGQQLDAWDYKDRIRMYKFLILNINNCAWADKQLADDEQRHWGNLLWGLPLQHGWQFTSERLTMGPSTSTKFTAKAWWGCMNYFLSVIPYFGAVEAGLAPPVKLEGGDSSLYAPFCASPADCPELVEPWRDYFRLVNATKDGCSKPTSSSSSSSLAASASVSARRDAAPALNYHLDATTEGLLASLWAAHLHSIDAALPLFSAQLAAMSAAEAEFGRAWAGLVDLIAAARFPCNNTMTNFMQNLLPPRLLVAGDKAALPLAPGGRGGIAGLSFLQNRAVFLIDEVYRANATTRGEVARLWDRGMCAEQGRALGREMITMGFYRVSVLAEAGVKLAAQMAKDVVSRAKCDGGAWKLVV